MVSTCTRILVFEYTYSRLCAFSPQDLSKNIDILAMEQAMSASLSPRILSAMGISGRCVRQYRVSTRCIEVDWKLLKSLRLILWPQEVLGLQ